MSHFNLTDFNLFSGVLYGAIGGALLGLVIAIVAGQSGLE
jgi:hypothetical protein